jgi:hypothetical protein
MEEGNISELIDSQQPDENIIDIEEIPQEEGLCPKCLGSHFRIQTRNGVTGVLYSAKAQDSEGRPIKRLVHCDCNVTVTY